MKIPPAHMFPASFGSLQSLVELLAAALAENGRQAKLLDELRQENAVLKQEIVALKQENAAFRQENLALQDRLNRDSTNSNQPPSQDSPFQKLQKPAASVGLESRGSAPAAAKKSRPYHKGVRQQLLRPDEVIPCAPGPCSCGCPNCVDVRVGWIHQWIELPKRLGRVVHFHAREGRCARCGKQLKGRVPPGHETGFGPGLTALIATWNAGMAVSRRKIADGLREVFGIPLSQGAIDKCLKRAATAILPHYEAIGRAVRASPLSTMRMRAHGGNTGLWGSSCFGFGCW